MKTPALLTLVLALLLGFASVASAQWTAVGSTGDVDDADRGIYDTTTSGAIGIKDSAGVPATLNVRYNLTRTDGLTGGDGTMIVARFRDNGAQARVVARLKQVSFATGATTTLMTIDSNDFGAATGFQTQNVSNCSAIAFDFVSNAYYVDVFITKSDTGGTPALQLLQVSLTIC